MINTTIRFLGATLTLWLAGTALAQAGALYKWVGADGSVHYSAQSPVPTSSSQSIQRLRLHAKGSREILAPDFDSRRNIVAAEANAMMAQDEERFGEPRSGDTAAKVKPMHGAEPSGAAGLQAHAAHAVDHPAASAHDGSPKTLVDALTDPVQIQ